jgi:diaminohydroxyphosphoribosylaminopyrimidine deaminase/5-amino-6-(5-phosphoribosylamino)uracil reductase
VGCVIERNGVVVGEGFHRKAGGPHAEVLALQAAGERAHGATVYVTLEPCAHHGRTPPCADALVAAGVARVVVAAEDPFEEVNGRGMALLREAGIEVECGLMRAEARELNVGFFSRLERGRPFVRVKLAMSLDGRTALANGESRWITSEAAREDVQRWRARSSAILTGMGTVLADDPRLTVRLPGDRDGVPPARVLLDTNLRTPIDAHVLDGQAPTWVMHAPEARASDARFERVECIPVPASDGNLDLVRVLDILAARDCNELHVEAGATLCGALFAQGLVDELLLYIAPVLLGDTARPLLALPALDTMAARWQLGIVDHAMVGGDVRLRLRPQR